MQITIVIAFAIVFIGSSAMAQCCPSKKCNSVKTTTVDKDCKNCGSSCVGDCKDLKNVTNVSNEVLIDGNVWITEGGEKYFICPVMKNEAKIEGNESFSIVDNVKYYHCCPSCQVPFRANPGKYLNEFTLPGNIIKIDIKGIKHFRDRVNGKEGVVDDDTRYFDHQGRRFYFDSKKSMKSFKKNPDKFMQL